MSSSPKQHSLETITFNDSQVRIQSPYSKLALRKLGLNETKLYFKSKADYINNHPDLVLASPHIQDNQYTKHESRRLDRIKKAKDLRNDLLNKSSSNSSKELYNSSVNLTSFLMQKEMEKIEQMKLHQIGEIKSIIDYEVYVNELSKRNAIRMKHLQEKEEENRKKHLREQEEREKKNVLVELERERLAHKEEKEAIKKKLLREEEERIRRDEETKRRERIERDALSKLLERKKFHEESHKKIEEIVIKSKGEIEERQKELEQKEEYRMHYIEQKKQEAILKIIQTEKHAIETYNIAVLKNEENINSKLQKIEEKQNTIREAIKKYNDDLDKKTKEQLVKNLIKEKSIQENNKKSDKQIQLLVEDYEMKKEIQNKFIEEKEKKSNWELFKKISQRDARNQIWKERKRRNDSLFESKKSKITLRQSQSEEKVQSYKEKEKQVTYDKFTNLRMRKVVNSENLAEYEKLIQFHNMEKMKRYQLKLQKISETENERKEIIVKKKNMEEEIQKRKEMLLKRINRIVNSNNYNSQDDIYQKILSKEQYRFSKQLNNSSSHNISNSTSRYGTRTRFASPNLSQVDSSTIKDRRDDPTNTPIKLEHNRNPSGNSNNNNNLCKDIIITQIPTVKAFNKADFNPLKAPSLDKIVNK